MVYGGNTVNSITTGDSFFSLYRAPMLSSTFTLYNGGSFSNILSIASMSGQSCTPVRLLVSLILSLLGPFMQHNSQPCYCALRQNDDYGDIFPLLHPSQSRAGDDMKISTVGWRHIPCHYDGPSPDHRPAEVVKISLHRAAAADCSP